jgi:hypothetical protein
VEGGGFGRGRRVQSVRLRCTGSGSDSGQADAAMR